MRTRGHVVVSPTKLDTWQDCRMRYRLQYLDKRRVDGSWAHLSLGNAVHSALRDWFDLEDAERTPAAAGALVDRHWSRLGFRDDDQSARWQTNAARMVERYCTQHPAAVPFGRERSLAALGEHVAVNGRIDRLDEAADPAEPGELIVIDYKTGRRVPTDDDARVSRALAVYAVIVQRSLRRPAFVVQLHHVPSGVIATHRHTPQSLERQFARVESIGRDIAAAQESGRDADFPPSPGPLCAFCAFREWCPASAATSPADRWSALPAADDAAGSFPA